MGIANRDLSGPNGGRDSFYALVTDALGNQGATGTAALSTTVTVLPPSIGSVSAGVPSIYAGQSVTLTANGLSPGVSYHWRAILHGKQRHPRSATGVGGDQFLYYQFGAASQNVLLSTVPGTYTCYAIAVDSYGNKSATGTAAPQQR